MLTCAFLLTFLLPITYCPRTETVHRSPPINFNVNVKRPIFPLYIVGNEFVSLQRFTFRQSPTMDRRPIGTFGIGSFFVHIIEETRFLLTDYFRLH